MNESEFSHDESNKASRSYLITAFDKIWDSHVGDWTEFDWQHCFSFEQLARQVMELPSKRGIKLLYIRYQVEICPETQRPHFHMAFQLSEPVKHTFLCNRKKSTGMPDFLMLDRVNFKSIYQMEGALKYCSKEESRLFGPWEGGQLSAQGKRSDLALAVETMAAADWGREAMKRVAEDHPCEYVKYAKGLTELCRIRGCREPAKCLEEVIVCWGTPGSGKSFYANSLSDSTYAVPSVQGGNVMPYFDKYANEEVCFFDEFQGSCFKFSDWKRVIQPGADPTKQELVARYNSIRFGSRVVVFCTNRNPCEWWNMDHGISPWEIFRRFTTIRFFGGEFGSTKNPAWRVSFSGGESGDGTKMGSRAEFMAFCLTAKSSGWDIDYIAQRAKSLWYDRRDWENGMDVETLGTEDTNISLSEPNPHRGALAFL